MFPMYSFVACAGSLSGDPLAFHAAITALPRQVSVTSWLLLAITFGSLRSSSFQTSRLNFQMPSYSRTTLMPVSYSRSHSRLFTSLSLSIRQSKYLLIVSLLFDNLVDLSRVIHP